MSPPQASSYPGSGNGRPGIHPPSHPPHCAKPEESGPLILRYNTHFSTDQWTAGGVLFISLCLLCVSPAFAEFSFTCLVGLTNALEQDGFISGFMGFYVKKVRGGPALNLPPPLSFKHFKFIVRCFAVSPGRASHEHGLRGDDVLLGGRPSLPPLPHYHPPHVQRVSSSRPALLRAHRVLIKNLLIFCPRRKSYRSLALLWAGSSMAHQIVLVPGVVVGECHLNESTDPSHHYPCCLWLLFFYEWCSCSCR